MIKFNLILITVLVLWGCSTAGVREYQYPDVSLEFENEERVRYRGKGSAAVGTFVSALGPTGIAVGIAIDEGIGKEIDTTYQSKYRFSDLLEEEVSAWLMGICAAGANQIAEVCSQNVLNIQIIRYGFEATPGKNDPVIPSIQADLQFGARSLSISSTGEFVKEPLEKLKRNADSTHELLRAGIRNILEQFEAHSN